ncbi:hypothetical protein HYDPIDRAFT_133294 [Hydnomerulius pinastri MD-312]|uniref:FAS1 domain-containing protein n=1 Tax=Hydnomerulius pinastri MD-312 TaxID=994086 RepID=A0A0C9VZV1_9AGAM|nr:hypothetical protein HYDPIDRAFT_133294 [Hydnomerulius pinastri MD-312]
MFCFLSSFVFLALVPSVLGQSYLEGLVQTLNANGLTQLASIGTSLNGTTIGQQVLAALPEGNKTLFAPTNAALSALDPAVAGNQNLLSDIIAYHVVSGNFVNQSETYPNVTIGRTLLNDSALVMLEGGKAQVLPWSKAANGSMFALNGGSNVTISNMTTYNNTEILIIDSVLMPPPNMTTILGNASYELTSLSSILQSTALTGGGSSILNALTSAHGITVFAPNNAAIAAAQSTLSGLASNTTALTAVLVNHIINGTSVYSPEIRANQSLVSAGGEQYSFTNNATGLFVSSGGSSPVQIVQSDVLVSNGVIHIVNGVLVDTSANPGAASSAYASATSIAAQTVAETGPVGASPTSTGSSGGSSGGAVMNGAPNPVILGVVAMLAVGQML